MSERLSTESVDQIYKDWKCSEHNEHLLKKVADLESEVARLREALTPSEKTKAAYMGEFGFSVLDEDEDRYEMVRIVDVPWTVIKEIMAAIVSRSALEASDE